MTARLARQGATFTLVGLAATGAHVTAALIARRLGAEPMAANLSGYLTAVSVSYLGNAWLTFRSPALDGPQFVRFAVVSLLGLGLNMAITWAVTGPLGRPYGWSLAAVAIAVPALSFVLSKFWAFRD